MSGCVTGRPLGSTTVSSLTSAVSRSSSTGRGRTPIRRDYSSVDQLARHRVDRDPPHNQAVEDERAQPRDVGPALEPEDGVAHELDRVMERVQLCEQLHPLRKLVEWEERAREQEE